MSFINLLSNEIWSDNDITNRTEAILRSEFPVQAELILNRKVVGQIGGMYQMTDSEKEELTRYQVAVENARQEGIAARYDNELLKSILVLEDNIRRLNQPAVEPILDESGNVTNQEEIDLDILEKQAALVVVESATDEQRYWMDQRHPPIEMPLEPTTIVPETPQQEVNVDILPTEQSFPMENPDAIIDSTNV